MSRRRWTRKLGELEAIDPALRGPESEACGSVAIIRSRLVAGGQATPPYMPHGAYP